MHRLYCAAGGDAMNERAARAMGWTRKETVPNGGYWIDGSLNGYVMEYRDWTPTTNIAQAWMLVEKCREAGINVTVYVHPKRRYEAVIEHNSWDCAEAWYGNTAAEAITSACVEALEAHNNDVE